jgi:multiple sugar transport system permease protein
MSTAPASSPEILTARPHRDRLAASEHRRMARRYRLRQLLTALGFLLPFAVFFVVFLVVPIVQVVFQTFQTGGLSRRQTFAGLSNWENVFNDPVVYQSLENSVRYAIMVIRSR